MKPAIPHRSPLIAGILVFFVALQFAVPPLSHAASDAGQGPVDFTLEKLDGESVSLSDFRGEWLVLNYWATWCAPCRKEMPELSALHQARDDITVLGLAYEDIDESAFEAFVEEFDVRFPVARVDVYAPPEPFGAPKVLPTTIILDPRGHAVKTFFGPVTRDAIEAFIDEG